MRSGKQITLDAPTYRRASRRAKQLGLSMSEYIRGLVVNDLAAPMTTQDMACAFDLGSSGGSDIRKEKDSMIGAAFALSQ